ncbi:type II toxin-antitoxin system HicA family toxin [Desulfonatronum thioautotrophicum]|uniref:type II toxin-antitoxin system HicA family toxin n=1 Tax=Desulfonatronum thioautotrophicum TaxID=617001 RepID=UPI001294762B
MTIQPALTFREFITRVERPGFVRVRQKGSHIRLMHIDGRKTTIPDHGGRGVPKGLMSKIIRHDLEMSMDAFFNASE